jgi:hypothetical protein
MGRTGTDDGPPSRLLCFSGISYVGHDGGHDRIHSYCSLHTQGVPMAVSTIRLVQPRRVNLFRVDDPAKPPAHTSAASQNETLSTHSSNNNKRRPNCTHRLKRVRSFMLLSFVIVDCHRRYCRLGIEPTLVQQTSTLPSHIQHQVQESSMPSPFPKKREEYLEQKQNNQSIPFTTNVLRSDGRQKI